MATPILTTKLHIPTSKPFTVARQRLIERLNQAGKTKLTIISAPAGYGKSMLFSDWAHRTDLPTALVSLDPSDNNLKRFISYIIAAFRTIMTGFGELTQSLLENPETVSAEALFSSIINELSTYGNQVVLALDDYHVIQDASIHQAVAFMIEHLPDFAHLFILTRTDPPFPTSRLRVQHQLVEIRADELRFTTDETALFFADTANISLNYDQVRALEKRTEGWITGLQLATLSMQDLEKAQLDDFISDFTGSHHYIVDYLLEEVLNRQTMPMREFLLKTSILEQMSGSLCNALTGQTDGHAILEGLEKRNLFIISLDEQRQWFRYHHLLADVMQNQLQQTHPGLLPVLHQNASQWFEAHGYLEQAIRHAIVGKDLTTTIRLIEENAMALLMRGELVTLLNWIKPIEAIAAEKPWLSTYKSWALTLTGQLDLAQVWLQKAESAVQPFNQENRQELTGHIEAIKAYIANAHGDAAQAIAHAQKALNLLSENNQVVRSVVTFTLGIAYRAFGDQSRATQALKAARRAAHLAGNRYLELGAVFALADLTFDQGKLYQAFDIYKTTLQLATQPGGLKLPAAGMAYIGLGLVYLEWNDLRAAEENIQQAIDLCQRWGHFVNLTASFVLLSRLRQAQGDLVQAEQAIQKAEELVRTHVLALRAESWAKAFRVQLWLAQGNLTAATQWASQSGLRTGDEFIYLREAEYFTLGRVYLAIGQADQALALSQNLQGAAEASGRMGSLIESFVLQALAYQAQEDIPEALESLASALKLAHPQGYRRIFINEGLPIFELLQRAGSRGIEPEYVAELVSAFELIPEYKIATQLQPLIEPLSDRELEVIHLIASGCTNSEIAEELFITVGTVKAHTNNIYRKLNVRNRTQAIAQARALGLL
ncbi:MAG: LuxR C-terminal-related transcriptional regulator [Anaerolineales bacterium]